MAKSTNKGVINLFGKGSGSGDGVKYSQLLERLIAAFEYEFPEDYDKENVVSLAVSAWNFANLKGIMPVEEFKKVMSMAPEGDSETLLVKKMIAHKYKEFRDFERFIVDYELKEKKGEAVLTVITQEKEAYLQEMMEEAEAGMDEDDFDEGFIDRSAVIVVPKEPFFEWYRALYPKNPIAEKMKAANTYLVDYIEDLSAMDKWMDKRFDYFFKSELNEWHTDKKDWPKKRTYAMFKEWFQVIPSTEVYDIEYRPIHKVH